MTNKYMQAAGAGPNMASRGPALAGQAQAHTDMVKRIEHREAGSGAGLRTARSAVIEHHGAGYGNYRKMQSSKSVDLRLGRPIAGMGPSAIKDYRAFKRPALTLDRDLAKLV